MADGVKAYIKLSPSNGERNSKFRDHDAMTVLGVPDVVVREAVHVDLELPVVVEVHVRNEDNV